MLQQCGLVLRALKGQLNAICRFISVDSLPHAKDDQRDQVSNYHVDIGEREIRHTNDATKGTTVEVLGGVGLNLPKGKSFFLLCHDHTSSN